MDDTLSFEGESSAVRCLDFRIYKDETNVAKLNDDIIYVLWSDVVTLGEDAYYVPASLGIKADDTVCIWDGDINENTRFFKVLLAAAPKKVDGKSMSLLTTEESLYSDVLDELDIYTEGDVQIIEYLSGADLDNLALNAKKQ